MRFISAIFLAVTLWTTTTGGVEAQSSNNKGLQVPRFVSLKSDKVHVRQGPSRDHQVAWIYTKISLPVEITAEFENWRRIRDSDGAEGWVFHSLLSGRRTALVAPWGKKKGETLPLQDKPEATAGARTQLEAGVLVTVKSCNGSWCRVTGEGFDGFVSQTSLWGVYPNEKFE